MLGVDTVLAIIVYEIWSMLLVPSTRVRYKTNITFYVAGRFYLIVLFEGEPMKGSINVTFLNLLLI